MPWVYEQATGKLFAPDGALTARGYAGGNCGKNHEGKNNPDMQDVPCVGPLPVGLYHMETPMNHKHLGPYAIPLLPDTTTQMFGRSAFYIHGDSKAAPGKASEGCIIMPRLVREACWESKDHELLVVRGDEDV